MQSARYRGFLNFIMKWRNLKIFFWVYLKCVILLWDVYPFKVLLPLFLVKCGLIFFKGRLGVKESFIAGLMKNNISAFHKQHISIFESVELLFLIFSKPFPHYFFWDRFLNLSEFMNSFNFSKTLFVVGFTIC